MRCSAGHASAFIKGAERIYLKGWIEFPDKSEAHIEAFVEIDPTEWGD